METHVRTSKRYLETIIASLALFFVASHGDNYDYTLSRGLTSFPTPLPSSIEPSSPRLDSTILYYSIQAYEILSDAEKRKKYDLFGLVDDGDGGGGGGGDPFGDGFDPFTVFQQMFERQGGGNREKGLGFRYF